MTKSNLLKMFNSQDDLDLSDVEKQMLLQAASNPKALKSGISEAELRQLGIGEDKINALKDCLAEQYLSNKDIEKQFLKAYDFGHHHANSERLVSVKNGDHSRYLSGGMKMRSLRSALTAHGEKDKAN